MADKHKCMNCGNTSHDHVLLKAEVKGKESWVCAGCLPMIIHGG